VQAVSQVKEDAARLRDSDAEARTEPSLMLVFVSCTGENRWAGQSEMRLRETEMRPRETVLR